MLTGKLIYDHLMTITLSNLQIHDPDSHALFTHYIQLTESGSEFVICCACRHWIERTIPQCACPNDCHALARALTG